VAELLGVDPELATYVVQELVQGDLLTASGTLTDHGRRMLDESDLGLGDMRVGWVFQDTWTGRLLPRFVTRLDHADVESDADGRAWVRGGSKGTPRRDWAFVLRAGPSTALPPAPIDVLDAARRHRRHERRVEQSGLDLEFIPAEAVEQISLISSEAEPYHLLTFVYAPENAEDEDEPWYVADPFGFGASTGLREQLEQRRAESEGGLRDILDRITGEQLVRQREAWVAMQELIRSEARDKVEKQWSSPVHPRDERVRERLVLAFEELVRLEQEFGRRGDVRDRIDGGYLKLRQAVEQALMTIREAREPGDAWRKLFHGDRWMPRDSVEQVVTACARACGFDQPPQPIRAVHPSKVKAACLRADSANLRPLCAALVLAGADDDGHPIRRLAQASPEWLFEVNRIAEAAGAEVHGAVSNRLLADLRRDANVVVSLCDVAIATLTRPEESSAGREPRF
jgi:hypothetical protein